MSWYAIYAGMFLLGFLCGMKAFYEIVKEETR